MSRTVQQLFDLTGKTALVTGGSTGLGLQMAHALGEAGARIMLAGCQADALEQVCADLQDAGIDARWTVASSANEADLHHLVSEMLQRMGDIDILVNYADAMSVMPMQEHALDPWLQVINHNLRAYAMLSQITVQKSMMARRAGRIINVAPFPCLNAQTQAVNTMACQTAKEAVMLLTRALASEWGLYNITVNAIGAGVYSTELPSAWLAEQSPWPSPSHDEDLKGVCVLMASDAGQYITGQWLAVDGGLSLLEGV
jgi:NAD(P)-dependent dehydrogenase (short-subunit alcohol dehydrogenase family)